MDAHVDLRSKTSIGVEILPKRGVHQIVLITNAFRFKQFLKDNAFELRPYVEKQMRVNAQVMESAGCLRFMSDFVSKIEGCPIAVNVWGVDADGLTSADLGLWEGALPSDAKVTLTMYDSEDNVVSPEA